MAENKSNETSVKEENNKKDIFEFTVIETVIHDGKEYLLGNKIPLTKEQAEPLLNIGAIK
jgi:hypothetical protein